MEIGKTKLDDGWLASRYTEVDINGVQLTTTHPPTGPVTPWMKAVVPGTVLTTLLENNRVPDPFYGLQNESVIDIADSGRNYYTFWFFKRFTFKQSRNQYLELTFRAVNYSAEVFLNGHKKILPNGMFRRHSMDITDILNPGGHNLLAVLLHPPEHPGRIPPQGGQGGDHEIGKDVAAQYVEGWDWMTPIRDRNTGIWDEVSISVTGPVKVIDPHLVASFFDNYKRVYLHASAELENKSSWSADCSLTIQVMTDIEGNICLIEHLQTQHISIPSHRKIRYTFPQLFFYKPNLWWPNGMGKQSLYHVNITVDVKGFGLSDSWKHHFGFRKIECYIDEKTGGRLFKVNGQHVFIRGGNWILSDALLRLSVRRYETDIKFHADMNLNMIRCWGGGLAERPDFYYWCDVYGLMVWQEFWITADCDGRGDPISNVNGPIDHELFLLCARDAVRLLRNHPSLVIWVGGNEQIPPDDINKALKDDLELHPYFEDSYRCGESSKNLYAVKDPSEYLDGTRVYVQGSLWDGFAGGDGSFTDGPYEIQNPEDFFREDFYKYGFNPEVGSVGMPVAATIKATMPAEGWQIPLFQKLPDGYIKEVPQPLWEYHKYLPYSKPGHVHDQILSYGEPKDLDDFCLKAQLVNYIQYRALLEGWSSFMWTKYTGVLIWKTQNPWNGFRGQLYDHLHDQTAGFYGCRHAAEAIHVQLNLATHSIEVVNTTSEALDGVAVEASVWDLEGYCPYYKVFEKLSVPTKRTICIGEMMYPNSISKKPVYFVLLKLYDPSNYSIFSRNFYWLHLPGGDYRLLEPYKLTKIPLKITSETFIKGSAYKVQMQVNNVSKKPNEGSMLYGNTFVKINGDADSDMSSTECIRREDGLLRWLGNIPWKQGGGVRVTEVEGSHAGVAFFLHFSIHASEKDQGNGKDTRILPVHYSDNYISLVPGEKMSISISFEAPPGVTPRIRLHGWNFHSGHEIH